MTNASDFLTDAPLAGELVATDFDGWTDELKAEFESHSHDGHVGSRLLSENDRVRVWEIRLAPGQRWHAHRHVLDYFWTAVNAGRSRQQPAAQQPHADPDRAVLHRLGRRFPVAGLTPIRRLAPPRAAATAESRGPSS